LDKGGEGQFGLTRSGGEVVNPQRVVVWKKKKEEEEEEEDFLQCLHCRL
jgi:hypothetical protein